MITRMTTRQLDRTPFQNGNGGKLSSPAPPPSYSSKPTLPAPRRRPFLCTRYPFSRWDTKQVEIPATRRKQSLGAISRWDKIVRLRFAHGRARTALRPRPKIPIRLGPSPCPAGPRRPAGLAKTFFPARNFSERASVSRGSKQVS